MTTNRDKIIAAAIKSGLGEAFWLSPQHPDFEEEMGMLERFYAIAFEDGRQAEREECAKVCDNNYWSEEIDWWLAATKKDVSAKAARKCAEAIRARGDTK